MSEAMDENSKATERLLQELFRVLTIERNEALRCSRENRASQKSYHSGRASAYENAAGLVRCAIASVRGDSEANNAGELP